MKQSKIEGELPIRIRKLAPSDVNFIFSSWLRSYRDSFFARHMTNTIYFSEHHKVIANLLKTCETYVAVSDSNVADIFGYVVGERIDGIFVLHYIYVKHTYRMLGMGKLLLSHLGFDPTVASMYTHHNKVAERLAAKFNLVFSPYMAMSAHWRNSRPENGLIIPELEKKHEK